MLMGGIGWIALKGGPAPRSGVVRGATGVASVVGGAGSLHRAEN